MYKIWQVKTITNMLLGKRNRELREEKGLLQRQVAASLEMDSCLYSKIERGERRCKREFVVKMAKILGTNEDELVTLWVTDQLNETISEEKADVAKEAIATIYKSING